MRAALILNSAPDPGGVVRINDPLINMCASMYWLYDCCKCIYANLFFIAISLKNAPNPGGVLARVDQ